MVVDLSGSFGRTGLEWMLGAGGAEAGTLDGVRTGGGRNDAGGGDAGAAMRGPPR
jgi:hypothetical protein